MTVGAAFNGSTSIITTTGTDLTVGAYTMGGVFYDGNPSGTEGLITTDLSGNNGPTMVSNAGVWYASTSNVDFVTGPSGISGYQALFWTKAAGTVTPRFHHYNGTSWSHTNASGNIPNGSGAITRIVLGQDNVGGSFFTGEIACVGMWNEDTTDGNIETYLDYLVLAAKSNKQFFTNTSLISAGTLNDDSANNNDEASRTAINVGVQPIPAWFTNFAPLTWPTPVAQAPTGGPARSAGGTTTITPTLGGVIPGRLAIGGRAIKPQTATATAESGWVQRANVTGGTATTGADVGQTRISIDTRTLLSGDTSPTFDQGTSPNSVVGAIGTYLKDEDCEWDIMVATGDDSAHGTGRSISATLELFPGDLVLAISASDTDTATAFTSPSMSATGITFGVVSERLGAGGVTTGNDSGIYWHEALVTSGSGSVSVTFSLSSGPSSCGPTALVRLRQVWITNPLYSRVSAAANATVTPGVVQPVLTIPAPTIRLDTSVTLTTVSPVLTVPAPTATTAVTVTLAAVSPSLTIPAPTISADATVTTATVSPSLTVPAPAVTTAVAVTLSTVGPSLTIPAPSISAGVTITTDVVSPSLTIPALSIQVDTSVTTDTVSPVLTIPAPTISFDVVVTLATVSPSLTIPAPTVTADAGPTPATISPALTIPAPTVTTAVAVTLATVSPTLTVPAVLATTAAAPTPAVVAPTLTIPAPSISAGVTITVDTVSPVLTLPAPTISAGVSITLTTVSPILTIPAPTISAGATITLSTVAPALTLPAPSIQAGGDATISVNTVSPALTIPAPIVTTAVAIAVDVVSPALTLPAPVITTVVFVAMSAVSPTLTVPAPTISAEGNVTVTLATVGPVLSLPSPTVTTAVAVALSTVSLVLTVPDPSITTDNATVVSVSTIQPQLSLPSPTISADVTIAMAVVVLVLAVHLPIVTTPSDVTVQVLHTITRYAHPSMRTYVSRG